jgi:hypothetical protein
LLQPLTVEELAHLHSERPILGGVLAHRRPAVVIFFGSGAPGLVADKEKRGPVQKGKGVAVKPTERSSAPPAESTPLRKGDGFASLKAAALRRREAAGAAG